MLTTRLTCAACGTRLRDHAKFCDECGTPTETSSGAPEYKQVTVLFADVVRSMAIAAALDMERLREIMSELLEHSATVVHHYGGTVESTGDGVMAIFGAPLALEDHAFRACLAAVEIQREASRLADRIALRDGVALKLRVGLNSGRVIAGELGGGTLGFTATGEAVGMAQRMESVAPPGGVMLSESTARLVEHTATLDDLQWVRIKGSDEPVRARRLLAVNQPGGPVRRTEAGLVGRQWEIATLDAILDRTTDGSGAVTTVTGPAGIGKSRIAREIAAKAAGRGTEVYWAFCESHARDIPFGVVARLLRTRMGVSDLEGEAARRHVRARLPDADPQDLSLLDDLLGIADPDTVLPRIDPDARRRRLTALIHAVSLARTKPALFIIEDAHWIDSVSDSMLADFATVIPHTPSMLLITARPEYEGALTRLPGAQTIALVPLADSDTAALVGELVGRHPTARKLAEVIVGQAGGNPFFAEEMVRELAQRGVLTGGSGRYVCSTDVDELDVPATVQATIAARIDRLTIPARRTLTAASVIGAHFEPELLTALGLEPAVDELLSAELIDQVKFTPRAEFAFHHPLIRAVAYESQLKSERAEWHRRFAAAIQEREPGSVEENAAEIAEHLQAAGELDAAYGWHMRAGTCLANRDISAARLSWERACRIADQLPESHPQKLTMRIAPRTMLRATDWQATTMQEFAGRFEELRELCTLAGDKISLAIGMTGLTTELLYAGHAAEGSRLAAEQMILLESIGDPNLTVGLSFVALATWFDSGELDEILRWSQTVIELADGDSAKGAVFGLGSPLAAALALRGVARCWLGRAGWRQDLHDAVAMAQQSDTETLALIAAWTYGVEIGYGVLRADDSAMRVMEEAAQTAEATSNDHALFLAGFALAVVLLYRDAPAERQRGLELMTPAVARWRERAPYGAAVAEAMAAWERARRGDRETSIPVLRRAVDELHAAERLGFGVLCTGILVQTLIENGTEHDLAEAGEAIDQLANLRPDRYSAVRDITLLRLRALLSGAQGDDAGYRELVSRYRSMADSLGYEGHIAIAAAM